MELNGVVFRLPHSTLENASMVEVAYLDQSCSVLLRGADGERILQPQHQM